ncbi:MAG: polyprenyl synthetase family protein [Hyphomicrobium sp.]
MRHALFTGGKRFRPYLVLESAALFGVPAAQPVNTVAAVECIHCYSLVHDDLPTMDDDDVRRGQPTVHKAYDEWTAILAGDAC